MADNYTTIAVTRAVRSRINTATARAMGLTERRLSNSDVLMALIEVAERHPEEVKAELDQK